MPLPEANHRSTADYLLFFHPHYRGTLPEIMAIHIFGELPHRLRSSPHLITVAYVGPPTVVIVGGALWLGTRITSGDESISSLTLAVGTGLLLLAVLIGAALGKKLEAAERQVAIEAQEHGLRDLRHDIRRSLTVVRGEVELILSQENVPPDERQASSQSIIQEVERVDDLLRGWCLGESAPSDRGASGNGLGAEPTRTQPEMEGSHS
jgi:signal transduction histidine kinase